MEKVLVVSPHMDDEVLGVGGTIQKHIDQGDLVKVCFLCHRKYGNKFDKDKNENEIKCSYRAKDILGYQEIEHLNLEDERLDIAIHLIIEPLTRVAEKFNPDVIYVPSFADNNQDHRSAFEACMVVFRPFAMNYRLLAAYEVHSSTDQSAPVEPFNFRPNLYVDIFKYLGNKIKAMETYDTERRNWPHPRSAKAIEVMANKRGMEVNLDSCESLMILRQRV